MEEDISRQVTISDPIIIPRAEHTISRSVISQNALKVLYRLKEAGYQASLVGGCVRDMLLGREPKDFDVTTNARPEEVKALFRNCRLIGRRFRLAHVHFGREIIEVATFRAQHTGDEEGGVIEDGMILRDNVYGTIEDDVWRRDFTVNALYYNIEDFSVIDYTNGVEDLKAGVLRLIGSPLLRYKEDPVRMLRVVRFASKLGFRIDPDTEAPLGELGYLLAEIPPARLYEEVLKLFLGGSAVQTFELLRHYDLFKYLFPQTDRCLAKQEGGFPFTLLIHALTNTDERISQDKPVTPSFLYAAMLWQPMHELAQQLQEDGMTELQAIHAASREVTSEQIKHVILPRRFGMHMREIWMLQPRLRRITGKRPSRLVHHPRFRAAYDFLLLRAQAGEDVQDLCDWWTEFQLTVEPDPQQDIPAARAKKRSRRPRRKPRTVHASSSGE